MATSKIKGLDEQLLEGGGGGGGMGRGSSVSGTKWSGMPSFKGNSSTLGDIKKILSESEHLKGGARKAVEEARGRAAKRTAVRVAGADAAYEGAKAMVGDNASAKDTDKKSEPIEARFREVKEESPEAGEMSTHYKSGGKTSASRRADGIAMRGKTRGKVC
jgi:hypothetical protein